MTIDTNHKVEAYKAWKAGQSKASLALEYDVSPRTMGRWIDEVEETGYVEEVKPVIVEAKKDDLVKDLRYLKAYENKNNGSSNADLVEYFGVSESTVRRWLKKAQEELKGGEVELSDSKESVKPASAEYRYVASSRSISVTQILPGGVTETVSSDKSAPQFADLLDKMIEAEFSQAVLEDAFYLLQPAKVLEKFTQGKIQVDPANKKIYYVADEDTVPYLVNNSLTTRVIDMLRNGEKGVQTLLNFLEKLMENPSRRAVNELYGFLEANDIQIAEDGDFLAWKKVRNDYMDIHSNTMDNSPGKSPRVARSMVDEDSETTCSYGLHVCSQSYLPHFGNSSSSRVVRVKVNPSDVVAIPKDYDNAKMRCAGYTVLEDVTEKFYQIEDSGWD